jgi:uncharacterized SAM-dependent methyltransferase
MLSLIADEHLEFYFDVIRGLSQHLKQIPAKYFYDTTGGKIFQEIMHAPEYYVTGAEMEIFTSQADKLVNILSIMEELFDLVEFGPGDCAKSINLMRGLMGSDIQFNHQHRFWAKTIAVAGEEEMIFLHHVSNFMTQTAALYHQYR